MESVCLSVLLANTGKIVRRRGVPFLISCVNHLSWRPLTGPHCLSHTLKRERKNALGKIGFPNLFQRAESCCGSQVCLPCSIFSSCLLASASSSNRERGLLVNSGWWGSSLAWRPAGCVTLCRFLSLSESETGNRVLSRPSGGLLSWLKNRKAL